MLDRALEPIRAKVVAGQRLGHADGLALCRTRDIFTLGELADLVRRRRHGRKAYYNINRHINYTNYCVLRCKFCSFYRPHPRAGEAVEGGYELSIDEIVGLAAEVGLALGRQPVHVNIVDEHLPGRRGVHGP